VVVVVVVVGTGIIPPHPSGTEGDGFITRWCTSSNSSTSSSSSSSSSRRRRGNACLVFDLYHG